MIYYIRNEVDDLIGFEYQNQMYYYVKNIQNDIIGILDQNGNKVVTYTYDSWGNILSIIDSNNNDVSEDLTHIANINPFRYRSYYYDVETKLYYLNSRYYNPLWGRFLNADNYITTGTGILGHNMCAYCNNNSIMYKDETGHGIGFGLLAGALALGVLFVVNSIRGIKKSKKEIKQIQKKTNIPDRTEKLNQTMRTNATTVQETVKDMSIIPKLATFKDLVKDGAVYDLKLTEEWDETISYEGIIMEPQDIGNFHYGYIARAINLPYTVLFGGAGLNQLTKEFDAINCFSITFCDDPRDTIFMRLGAMKYDEEN